MTPSAYWRRSYSCFCLLFLSRLRRPPCPPLFPYTTLFRSSSISSGAVPGASTARRNAWSEPTDRKSTRLNSSHVSISYAVFCLKKKKALSVHIKNNHLIPGAVSSPHICPHKTSLRFAHYHL